MTAPRPRFQDSLRLLATRSAINCARLFVEYTLLRWRAGFVIADAVPLVDELVTDAVRAMGIMDEQVRWTELTRIEYIAVRLLGFNTSIRIEVWDSAPTLPVLALDDSSPVKRGCYATPGGKVVWAELPVLPGHGPSLHTEQERAHHKRPSITPPPEQFRRDDEVLRRVREGLEGV